ncbi:hypothetical protein LSH36_64g00017 [Paralvinella palmiformis]|uniref:protein-tyrosine-phosphatase n=1 Tax=Paralvinella palmiformis TaxID=53620 RepID=A0AAD9K3R5_9ANNE|nr:hypothetical protein LSH36_64g00017 [Paralvinella palmiformis]
MSFRRTYDLRHQSPRASGSLSNRPNGLLDVRAYPELPSKSDRFNAQNRKWPSYGEDAQQSAGLKVRYGRQEGWDVRRSRAPITNGYSYHGMGDNRHSQHAALYNGNLANDRKPGVYRSPANVVGVGPGNRYSFDNYNNNNSSQVSRSLDYGYHRLSGQKMTNKRQAPKKAESRDTEAYYLQKLREVIYDKKTPTVKASPAKVLDYLYLGSYWNAKHVLYLQKLGITHVLNCAATPRTDDGNPYHPDTGITHYMTIFAQDVETYDMLQHVERAIAFIDEARRKGGKIFVHCVMGVNRSGFIVAAYLIGALKIPLMTTVRLLKDKRGTVLYNAGFQKQLVYYARRKGLL